MAILQVMPRQVVIMIYDMASDEYYKASIQYKDVIYHCRYKRS